MYIQGNREELNRENILKDHISQIEFFNTMGSLIESQKFGIDGQLTKKSIFQFDGNNNFIKGFDFWDNKAQDQYWINKEHKKTRTENHYFNSKDNLIAIEFISFDSKGNKIEEFKKTPNGDTIIWNQISYNSKNQITKLTRLQGNKMETRNYQYDKSGLKYEFSVEENGKVIIKIENELDEHQNLIYIKTTNYDIDETHETKIEYIYDKFGNWITKKSSTNGKLKMIWEREIEYFQ